MSDVGFAGVANYAMTTTATAVRTMGVTGVGSSSETVQGPSLVLNFLTAPIDGPVLDPRITFSRTSNATVTNSEGVLTYAPHNLLTFSEQFDNAAWSKGTAAAVTANVATIENTTTADRITFTAVSADGSVQQAVTSAQGTTHTGSIWLWADAGEAATVLLSLTGASGGTLVNRDVTLTTTPTRYSLSAVSDATTTRLRLRCGTGQQNKSFYAWGAQLNVGALQPYYTTTVKNLLGFTQEFDNAALTKTNASIDSTKATAPDGSVTGQKLVENTANGAHEIRTTFYTPVANTPYTLTVYAKQGERRYMRFGFPAAWGGSAGYIIFDLEDGAVTYSSNAGLISSIQDVGNGWYRCRVTNTVTLAVSSTAYIGINSNSTTGTSYTGDGTSGIFIWGAQLSDSASLDEYVYNPGAAPAAAAYYGPRFDYDPVTLAPRGLLIEEQRTNSIRNNTMQGAVAGTPGTLPTNWSNIISAGLTSEIVGVGVAGGVSYIDLRVSGTPTGTSYLTAFDANTAIAASPGQTWTGSVYVEQRAGSTANILAVRHIITPRNAAAAALAANTATFTPTTLLARYANTYASLPVDTAFVQYSFSLQLTVGASIDITLRIGLPQLEQGAFATSVIPTTTAAATRAADVPTMTGANFSSWYNQTEGSFFLDYNTLGPRNANGFTACVIDSANPSTNYLGFAYNGASTNAGATYWRNGGAGVITTAVNYAYGVYRKYGVSFDSTKALTVAVDGAINATATSTTSLPTVDVLNIGRREGSNFSTSLWLRRIAYYPRRLSNAELQAITA